MVKALYQAEGLSQELAAFYFRPLPKYPYVRESSPLTHSADCLLSEGHADTWQGSTALSSVWILLYYPEPQLPIKLE